MNTCRHCASTNLTEILRPDTIHYAELRCLDCDRSLKWIPKPKEVISNKRDSEHHNLVAKYSEGFCQMCLRLEEELPEPEVLIAHHVIEYQDGGSSEKANIWILCSLCHQTIHNLRTYLGHYTKTRDLSDLLTACGVELKRTGYSWRSPRVLDFCEKACGKRNSHFLREAHLQSLLKKLQALPTSQIQQETEEASETA